MIFDIHCYKYAQLTKAFVQRLACVLNLTVNGYKLFVQITPIIRIRRRSKSRSIESRAMIDGFAGFVKELKRLGVECICCIGANVEH